MQSVLSDFNKILPKRLDLFMKYQKQSIGISLEKGSCVYEKPKHNQVEVIFLSFNVTLFVAFNGH